MRAALYLAIACVIWTASPCGAAPWRNVEACPPGDNHCIKLEPAARVYGATGSVRLVRPPGTPFTVDVDRDGRHRYVTEFELGGLPEPAALGDYRYYVAWVVDPTLGNLKRLGLVDNGVSRPGLLARNKYMVWVSAEADSAASVRQGPLVMRGLSPSTRMEAHGFIGMSAFLPPEPPAGDGWVPPAMVPGVQMMPGMDRTRPSVSPLELESFGDGGDGDGRRGGDRYAAEVARAAESREVRLAHGDTLRLRAARVERMVGGQALTAFAYNGQIPGPAIRVDRGSEIVVVVTNDTPEPTAVHWHGLRLENRFDGVPGLTQDPIPVGEQFVYRLRFPDAGIYWYHPHHREDIWQDAGLFGNIRVDADWLPPVRREELLVLDDLLLKQGRQLPYGREAPNFALMGRFGNLMLTNDKPRFDLAVSSGERLRLFLTNVSNTRTFNWSVDGHALEVMATDVGPFAEPVWVESTVIAPAERYVVDLTAGTPGRYAITNRVQSIDHARGRFFSQVDTLGFLTVGAPSGETASSQVGPGSEADVPAALPSELQADLPLLTLDIMLRTEGLPAITGQMMLLDQSYFNPVEWTGTMPHMNWSSTGQEVSWILRDPDAGTENMDVAWSFSAGDLVRVRLRNDEGARHAMQHPIHFHGQRFIVLSVDGEANNHRAWKDTVLVPVGSEIEILLEVSNPGEWMIHCHIAEHLASGMKMVFEVDQ
jgi:suppressor of ftsI